ncbi:aspartate racemase [Enterobacter sp. BIGb0383]|uniref:aspartate/glutamate racemase family protein n=1 Tax=unclassified Enterobacter TaxID=2608935 RepID=UPI000F461F29|nr:MULTISPECIES: amino acid racemase [unclassified Enterobacter]ROP60111.1 aspartate racemase [Enterobacter sp. BIGb0383]ROS08422.1 aspartate racemase [Enterobacter sp. BIGb0359]
MSRPFLLGVLGGMGPLATLDFQHKLLEATPAESDQQQLPSVVWNVPQVADRQKALAGLGPSPLPQLLQGIEKLNQAGASHIVIACNTAHHWYDALSRASAAPLLHIVDATLESLVVQKPQRVGIIATKGTLEAGWFQRGFAAQGIEAVEPTPEELAEWFVPGCYAVKRGALREGGVLLSLLADALLARGAERLVLACTEVPVALRAVAASSLAQSLDPAQALAQRCAKIWLAQRHSYLA